MRSRRHRSEPGSQGGRRPQPVVDPLQVLGLAAGASLVEIEAARRALAKRVHPDVGGSLVEMQRINAAADAAGRQLQSMPPVAADADAHGRRRWGPQAPAGRRDHPSFTIEALPAEAFEALLIVAGSLGDLIDDDPPYQLEVALGAPIAGWCRLELSPEAGASSVALSVAGEPGGVAPDLDRVRDAWIGELNRLDWDRLDRDRLDRGQLDGSRPRP